MTDQEIARLLKELPKEDLKDIAALNGAGSIARQAKARLKRFLSNPIVIFAEVVLLYCVLGILTTLVVDVSGVQAPEWSAIIVTVAPAIAWLIFSCFRRRPASNKR